MPSPRFAVSLFSPRSAIVTMMLATGGITTSAPAADILVRPDGSGDYPSIQEAIWASTDGDVITLTAGTYFESNIDLRRKAVTIRAQDGPGTSAVDGEGETVLLVEREEGADTVLSGLTFRSDVPEESEIVRCIGTTPIFEDCIFEGVTSNDSSALYVVGIGPHLVRCTFRNNVLGADLRGLIQNPVTDCTFEQNETGLTCFGGSGFRIEGTRFIENGTGLTCSRYFQGDLTVEDSDFEENGVGALLQMDHGGVSILSCRFVRNADFGAHLITLQTLVEGTEFRENGSLYLPGSRFGGLSTADAEVRDCLFERNQARHAGGLIGSGLTVRGSVFRENLANGFGEEDGFGGGAELSGTNTIEECLFTGNRAGNGGALYLEGQNTILDCTFAYNEGAFASDISTGISFNRAERIIVYSGTRGPSIDCGDNSTLQVSCSNFWGNSEGNWVDCITQYLGQDGNITADPLFCDPESGDFTLATGSPCLEDTDGCDTMGRFGEGCTPVPVRETSWGGLKSRFLWSSEESPREP